MKRLFRYLVIVKKHIDQLVFKTKIALIFEMQCVIKGREYHALFLLSSRLHRFSLEKDLFVHDRSVD